MHGDRNKRGDDDVEVKAETKVAAIALLQRWKRRPKSQSEIPEDRDLGCLMNGGECEQDRNVKKKIPNFEGINFDPKAMAELENEKRERGPEIEMNHVVAQRIAEFGPFVCEQKK